MLRPRSILQLVLIGFGIVTVPLLAAFLVTAAFVSDLSQSGQRAVVRAVDVIQESRVLVEQAVAMGRNGRQYLVLDDPAVAAVYEHRRGELRAAAENLRGMGLTDVQRLLLSELDKQEVDLYGRLMKRNTADQDHGVEPWEFDGLASLARGVLAESGQLITGNIQALNESADRVHRLLLWESIALVPVALGLAGIFVLLIIGPLKTLNVAIDRLGAGRFDEGVRVSGPLDLQKLGDQLESTRKRLQSLEKQKVFFLRHISHELKTPLTTLREGTQLLTDGVVGPLNADQQEVVDLIRANSIQLQRLIEDLLHFGAMSSSSAEIAHQSVRLDDLITGVLDEQRLPAQARGLVFDLELAPLPVHGDPNKLKTVFSNLVSNAIKFSASGTHVHASLSRSGSWVVFDIETHGFNIPVVDRERIFDAFYQGAAQHDGPVKGSGLGLFIAREFVRLHQGTIDVLDSAKGAHFRIRLPLAELAPAPSGTDDGELAVDRRDAVDGRLCDSDGDAGRQSGATTINGTNSC